METGRPEDLINNQKGMALITVLLVTSLVAVLAVSMSFAQHVAVKRTANLLEGDRALLLALGLEEWGRELLGGDDRASDNFGENWAMGLPPTAVDNGMISGSFIDLQGRINLNNLADGSLKAQTEEMLIRLFDICEADNSGELVLAVTDWVDSDNDGIAEDNEYLLHEPPYQAANQIMKSPSELLLVEGITSELYSCVQDHVATLPESSKKINVNTADPVVISTLSPDLSVEAAEEIVGDRPEGGYKNDLSDFLDHPEVKKVGSGIATAGLTTTSDYFLAHGRAVFGESEVELYSLIRRIDLGFPEVLGRSIGTY